MEVNGRRRMRDARLQWRRICTVRVLFDGGNRSVGAGCIGNYLQPTNRVQRLDNQG